MRSRVVNWIICGLLLVSVLRPVLPVWAGAVLIAFVTLRAGRDLSSPCARDRWDAFKRMAVMAVFGTALIFLGAGISTASLPSQAASSEAARHALTILALYSAALICVPMFIYSHLTRNRLVTRRRIRVSRSARTLSRMAAEGGRRMARVAV